MSVATVPANDIEHLAITSGIQSGDKVVVEGGVLVDRSMSNAVKPNAASQVKP